MVRPWTRPFRVSTFSVLCRKYWKKWCNVIVDTKYNFSENDHTAAAAAADNNHDEKDDKNDEKEDDDVNYKDEVAVAFLFAAKGCC